MQTSFESPSTSFSHWIWDILYQVVFPLTFTHTGLESELPHRPFPEHQPKTWGDRLRGAQRREYVSGISRITVYQMENSRQT